MNAKDKLQKLASKKKTDRKTGLDQLLPDDEGGAVVYLPYKDNQERKGQADKIGGVRFYEPGEFPIRDEEE